MKKAIILICLVVLCVVVSGTPQDSQFTQFLAKYNKRYTPAELSLRQQTFNENVKYIEQHNAKGLGFTLGINEFTDLSHKEFISQMLSRQYNFAESTQEENPTVAAPPASIDWRTNKNPIIVGPVRNASTCANDDVVAAIVDSISSSYSVSAKQDFYEFPLAQIQDCDGQGCKGTKSSTVWAYVTKIGVNWYYTKGACPTGPGLGLCIAGHNCTKAGSESELQAAVATQGPISVLVDASHSSFQLYEKGVYYEATCSSSTLDHSLLIVGYGSANGQDYWIARNSWGTSWGQSGDILLARNKNNNCGVASSACFATSVRSCVCEL